MQTCPLSTSLGAEVLDFGLPAEWTGTQWTSCAQPSANTTCSCSANLSCHPSTKSP